MENDKVAVATKIYRNEPEVQRALNSILNQTFTDIDFYIACGDETEELIEACAKEDNRIVVCKVEQSRAAAYMWQKICESNVMWYAWLDGDDWYDEDFLEKTICFARKEKTDIVVGGYREISENRQDVEKEVCMEMQLACGISETQLWFIQAYYLLTASWGILYKADLLRGYDIQGRREPASFGNWGADTLFTFSMLEKANRIGFLNRVFYNYQKNIKSETVRYIPNRKYAFQILFNSMMGFLENVQNKDFACIYFVYLHYGALLENHINLLMNLGPQDVSICERYNELKYILTQDTVYRLYDLLKRTRGDFYQSRYLYMVFHANSIFTKEQLADLMEIIYPQIFDFIQREDVSYESYEKVLEAKNQLTAGWKNSQNENS